MVLLTLQDPASVVVVTIEVGEALQAVAVLQVTVVVVLVDGEAEPSFPVEYVGTKIVVVVQSENVVLEVQDEEEEVEDLDSEEEFSLSSSFILFSRSVTISLISFRYSAPFLTVPSMSSVTSDISSGIVLIMLSTIGPMQLIASPTMFVASSTAPVAILAALEARLPIAPNRDLFLRDPEQGDLLEA